MFYSHIVAIAIKIIPYSLVLGFLLPRYSDMSTASTLTTALILAVITTTMDLVPLPEFIIPNVDHKTGLLISASLDVAITYAVIWFARLITMAASFSVIGFLLISFMIGLVEIILHMYFNWALAPRVK
jgi:FlaA1/EpsC-like NDP-sugar epimerase